MRHRLSKFCCLFALLASAVAQQLTPRHIELASGKQFDLLLSDRFEIKVAYQGLKRVRFFALAPDGRLFVTDMYNRADNRRGKVYVLDGFGPMSRQITGATPYLSGLRNPNSVAFYTDSSGQAWFYLALTDKLVRYRYQAGANSPDGPEQVLATFPEYGLNYKYGGWHLTRTIAVGANGKIYVSVGSSCDACHEKEEVRASVLEMDPDGKNQKIFVRGLRNAVGIHWIGDHLVATNMGADHLGPLRPDDTMYALRRDANYGWPYCYVSAGKVLFDASFQGKLPPEQARSLCRNVPPVLTSFSAHSSPLGFADFTDSNEPALHGAFVVALHGSSRKKLAHGYSLVLVREGHKPEPFLSGFDANGVIYGRPADVMRVSHDCFLFSDDYAGVIYSVCRRAG